jgi:HAD superfamily hydrolase (TIGR01484 family)
MEQFDFGTATILFTDVDDTLTTDGQLRPETYQALWRLAQANVAVVPVTGGCAGWCDQIIRTWPVSAVIGEGGAFYISKDADKKLHWSFWDTREQNKIDQANIISDVQSMAEGDGIVFAKDQPFRLVDVAIDYNQDHRMAPEQVASIMLQLENLGYRVKKSSIHLNISKGNFDKSTMALRLGEQLFGLTAAELSQQAICIGDAPNDESMFSQFPQSVGVANIVPHLDTMTHKPAYVTSERCGGGFVQLADHWLSQLQ